MAKTKKPVKVIVQPHYVGESAKTEIFKRVIIGEIRRKMKRENTVSDK